MKQEMNLKQKFASVSDSTQFEAEAETCRKGVVYCCQSYVKPVPSHIGLLIDILKIQLVLTELIECISLLCLKRRRVFFKIRHGRVLA